MFRYAKWFVVLGVTVLAFGLLFGAAMADPGDGDSVNGWNMHEQMDPELYGQMIQRMIEVHGAAFTAEMLQRMNEGGGCHGAGPDTIGAGLMGQRFDGTVGGFMRGAQRMMAGFSNNGMMDDGYGNGGGRMNGGMMGR